MDTDTSTDRESEELAGELITDPELKAEREVENGFRQFDEAMAELEIWQAESNYKLKPSLLLRLNRIALEDIHEKAGSYRNGPIKISGSEHTPPGPEDVPELVEQFCDYINEHWERSNALHLAAYCMWRLNWIHPFPDGNGRTSRIVSYLVLCASTGTRLPGKSSIPEQIVENKKPYYRALESADQAQRDKRLDISEMEKLLDSYLAKQLVGVHDAAKGDAGLATRVSKPNELVGLIESHPVIAGGVITLLLTILAWALS